MGRAKPPPALTTTTRRPQPSGRFSTSSATRGANLFKIMSDRRHKSVDTLRGHTCATTNCSRITRRRGFSIETEGAPIRYVAETLGTDTDGERAIRGLIALMTLCCDPPAIALTAAASARGNAP